MSTRVKIIFTDPAREDKIYLHTDGVTRVFAEGGMYAVVFMDDFVEVTHRYPMSAIERVVERVSP